MSNICLLTHIVISTYRREMVIGTEQSPELYKYITGIIKKNKCQLIAINGIPNHIHILIDLHPTIALSTLMKEVKQASSLWMKGCGRFPMFKRWSEGYFAASLSYNHKESTINYIEGQQPHHQNLQFENEYDRLILKNGMVFYKYPE